MIWETLQAVKIGKLIQGCEWFNCIVQLTKKKLHNHLNSGRWLLKVAMEDRDHSILQVLRP